MEIILSQLSTLQVQDQGMGRAVCSRGGARGDLASSCFWGLQTLAYGSFLQSLPPLPVVFISVYLLLLSLIKTPFFWGVTLHYITLEMVPDFLHTPLLGASPFENGSEGRPWRGNHLQGEATTTGTFSPHQLLKTWAESTNHNLLCLLHFVKAKWDSPGGDGRKVCSHWVSRLFEIIIS